MSINHVNSVGSNPCAYANSSRNTGGTGSFVEEVQKAAEENGTAVKSTPSPWEGDMVVPQPPSYYGFTYDSSISNKSKEEMTMEEYKQWFLNEMSRIPVSGWYRSTCVGGALIITEECFERMKNDPEWEKTVFDMIRRMYSSGGIMGTKMIGYQVIGATPKQCHVEGIPVKERPRPSVAKEKTWWEKRCERMKKLMKEKEKENLKKAQARREAEQEYYWNSQIANRKRLQAFLTEGREGQQESMEAAAFQMESISSLMAALLRTL